MMDGKKEETRKADRITVLLVEDNPDHAELLRRYIIEAGAEMVEVMRAGTLTAALAMVRDHPPDVVLLDLTLPESSGIETVRRFRREASHLPVIVCSASTDWAAALLAMREGTQEYIAKDDLNARDLWRALLTAIERNRWRLELQDAIGKLDGLREDLDAYRRYKAG